MAGMTTPRTTAPPRADNRATDPDWTEGRALAHALAERDARLSFSLQRQVKIAEQEPAP